jgi:hypothetical protein
VWSISLFGVILFDESMIYGSAIYGIAIYGIAICDGEVVKQNENAYNGIVM